MWLESKKGLGGTDVEKIFEEIVANIFPNLMKMPWNPNSKKTSDKGKVFSQSKETHFILSIIITANLSGTMQARRK